MVQITPSPSADVVLRFIKEEALIQKIKDSGLIMLNNEFPDEFENTLYNLFLMWGKEIEITEWDEYAKQILHNGTPEAREELKYISFDWYDLIDMDFFGD